jgi:hypothetical protein
MCLTVWILRNASSVIFLHLLSMNEFHAAAHKMTLFQAVALSPHISGNARLRHGACAQDRRTESLLADLQHPAPFDSPQHLSTEFAGKMVCRVRCCNSSGKPRHRLRRSARAPSSVLRFFLQVIFLDGQPPQLCDAALRKGIES